MESAAEHEEGPPQRENVKSHRRRTAAAAGSREVLPSSIRLSESYAVEKRFFCGKCETVNPRLNIGVRRLQAREGNDAIICV